MTTEEIGEKSITLLICGSREATPAMLDYARRAVARALAHGWFIIAGDAPGIDQAVAQAVADLYQHEDEQMLGMRIYGLAEQPRHGIRTRRIAYERVTHYTVQETSMTSDRRYLRIYQHRIPITTYAQRDLYMLRDADQVLCIWNGKSRGTLAVYNAARREGKPAWLRRDN